MNATAYVCEWERIDSPTRTMTDTAARDYYKAHSVRGDARFALRADSTYPPDLQESWRQLIAAIDATGKETASHRQTRDAIRSAWRLYTADYAYTAPIIALPTSTRKPVKRTACCPKCGFAVAA